MTGETKFGLPAEVRYCARCVISNQRPSSTVEYAHTRESKKETIHFDAAGVCAACRFAELKEKVDWAERERELGDLLARHRRTDGRYDVLVPGSGGKDSIYASHLLKYRYGMNPLTVTWAPHIYTEVGWRNFQSWIHAGFDNFLCTPNGRVHRTLTRLAFENLLHPFQPFIFGQKCLPPKFAALWDIPLVIYGENEVEYGNPHDEAATPRRDPRYYTRQERLEELHLGGVRVPELAAHGITVKDLDPYLPADPGLLAEKHIDVRYLGYYLKWIPQECYYYAVEHAAFEANTERTEGTYSKYNSIDDRMDGLHYYTTYVKFGLGRASYDAAQEIRNGHLTREEGVALVRRFDGELPTKWLRENLDYMGIGEARFREIVDQFRSPHLWKREGGQWTLRHQVS
ncbi:MAG: LPS biosynthesis protein [Candidatus Rokubacteria bacterium GWC2_70_16]|nr:MAG: LPS biosynthesis protein [Candidatus Rokubacteria bacterium GWC2_70_16]OGL17839.1 MAG: LPS biosynthesis protein [Candidatus Rokubacteria bacterium RIFCSPLOWO2_12_FULL_71_19]